MHANVFEGFFFFFDSAVGAKSGIIERGKNVPTNTKTDKRNKIIIILQYELRTAK